MIQFFLIFYSFSIQAQDFDLNYFKNILAKIKSEYVRKVDQEELLRGAIKGVLASLDDYSQYYTPEEYKEFLSEVEGKYFGIGVEIKNVGKKIIVVTPLEGSPAMKAGLRPLDEIVKVDGEPISGLTMLEVVRKIRGPKNSVVVLDILRRRESSEDIENLSFSINRDEINVTPVKSVKLKNDILYIRVSKFLNNVTKDIKKAVKSDKGKTKGIILDLRLNPGGLLKEALQTADLFMDQGLILETRSRHQSQQKKFYATKGTLVKNTPCVILIDKGSASASEIVAGALKDNSICVVLGEKSFGKGSVQTSFELPRGDAIILTTAEYYTKSGVKIDGNGIEPTFEVKNPNQTYVFNFLHNLNMEEIDDPVYLKAIEKIQEMVDYMQPEAR